MIHEMETLPSTRAANVILPLSHRLSAVQPRDHRRARRWVLGLVVVAAILVGMARYVGYIGGSVFTVVPATRPASPRLDRLAAVFLSGDVGFRVGMGPQIAKRLADQGIPVVGVNSLTFYRSRRTPLENEALIQDATRRALALPGVDRVVLIGQSFGADMLQAGLPAFPQILRRKVVAVALIVPGDTINYRASPNGFLSSGRGDSPAEPTARLLRWVPTICIKGQIEDGSLCPLLRQSNVTHVALPGGHMLHYDSTMVSDVLLKAISTAAAAPSNVAAFRLAPATGYLQEQRN